MYKPKFHYKIYYGTLAENSQFTDTLITNDDEYNKFTKSLALNCLEKIDFFLHKKTFDFTYHYIILVVGANISSVNVLNGAYNVKFTEKLTKELHYTAAIVNRYYDGNEINAVNYENMKPIRDKEEDKWISVFSTVGMVKK